MEHEEDVRATVAIPLVQRLDALERVFEQFCILRQRFLLERRQNRSARRIEGPGQDWRGSGSPNVRAELAALDGRVSMPGMTMNVA